jgi:hypothetical protein
MKLKEVLLKWVDYFNLYNYETLGESYAEDCINHQTPNGIVNGRKISRICSRMILRNLNSLH